MTNLTPKTLYDADRECNRLARHGFKNLKDGAAFLGIGQTKLWDLIRQGVLHAPKHCGRRVVLVAELRQYIAQIVRDQMMDLEPLIAAQEELVEAVEEIEL